MNTLESFFIGIDTSNYTTSIAVIDSSCNILKNERKLLDVKRGEKGLRQSDALFQHIKNLPGMIEEVFDLYDSEDFSAISVSDRPRSVEGSYMPVFLAGVNFGRALAAALNIPLYSFSHQKGHVEAIRCGSILESSYRFLSFHMSGGTSELLLSEYDKLEIVGGTKDISFGQVVDRIGVAMNMSFPAGHELDLLADSYTGEMPARLSNIKNTGSYFNLSGIETQCIKLIEQGIQHDEIAFELFDKLSDLIIKISINGIKEHATDGIIFAGGFSSSQVFRKKGENAFKMENICYVFGDSSLSSDNAVGTAILGLKQNKHSKGSVAE